jgi:CheY-like chemotaxis protein
MDLVVNIPSAGLILHVEDERLVREAVSLLLRAEGYTVISASDGAQALLLATQGLRPDVLIVDFHLDDQMNGAEVAERIRRNLGYTPPVIILTGDLSNAEVPCITGAPVWLTRKPLNPDLLLAALPPLVELSRALRGLPAASAVAAVGGR